MLEFIQLIGLKRILFLVGLILYIAIILIIFCLPEKKNSRKEKTNVSTDHAGTFKIQVLDVAEEDLQVIEPDYVYSSEQNSLSPRETARSDKSVR